MSTSSLQRQSASELLASIPMDTFRYEENEIQIKDDYICDYEPPKKDYSTYFSTDYINPTSINRSSINNEVFIKIVLVKHMGQAGCKFQLCRDLEKLSETDETNTKTFLAARKPNEINVLLLYASFISRVDLIHRLCEHGANVDYAEPDQGLTALHLCAFRNCLDGVQCLIAHGANVDINQEHTPFHYAAFGDSYDVAQYFVKLGVNQKRSLQDKETVLHAATRTNALRVFSLLAPNNTQLNQLDRNGFAAIHYAALYGNSECLKVLLQSNCQVNLLTISKIAALHLAVIAGCTDVILFLIKAKADLELKDYAGDTALHIAVNLYRLECVKALLKGNANPNKENNEGQSPLHQALSGFPISDEIIKLLLASKADVNKADKYGHTPLHIAASKELSRCVNLLIGHEADLSAKTKEGTSALSIILRKTPTCLEMFEQRLNEFVTVKRQGFVPGELELQMDFHPLLQHCRQSEISYLNMFVKEGYKQILQHPLCQSFLYLKWKNIRKFYIARLFSYLVYLLILMSWVMAGLTYNCYNESHNQMRIPPLCANASGVYHFFYNNPVILEQQCVMLVVLTVLEIVRKVTVLSSYLTVRQFFTQENLVDWCLILTVLAISCMYTGKTYVWQRYLGAFAVFCGWSNLMLMIGQFPMFGTYVAMFTSVQAKVFKLLLAYACLLVGFTLSFCIIFPYSSSFSSIHVAFIKILVMMTGEFSFENFFPLSNKTFSQTDSPDVDCSSWVFLHISAEFFFILFLLIVTITLMNLLIGIAVHDIKGLQKSAGLEKLVRQTNLIYDMEVTLHTAFLPKRLLKRLRWSALIQPLCAVITICPLNPREGKLPRDVLLAAYTVAKKKGRYNNSTLSYRNN